MKKLISISVVIILYSGFYLNGQKLNPQAQFTGRLIDQSTLKPVGYCHIFNETKRTGRISDSTGLFIIPASEGDTLVFIAMCYLGKTFKVPDNFSDSVFTIEMEVRYYDIKEVEYKIPRTYKAFREAFLRIDPKKDEPMRELPEYNPYIRPVLHDTNIIYSKSFRIWHPVSGIYYKKNKIEQSKRKLRYLQEQKLLQPVVDAKYNKEILSGATGFTGDTLLNFMLYCSFSFNFLYESTELEIFEEIDRKKKKFIEHCYGQCIPVIVPKKNRKSGK